MSNGPYFSVIGEALQGFWTTSWTDAHSVIYFDEVLKTVATILQYPIYVFFQHDTNDTKRKLPPFEFTDCLEADSGFVILQQQL